MIFGDVVCLAFVVSGERMGGQGVGLSVCRWTSVVGCVFWWEEFVFLDRGSRCLCLWYSQWQCGELSSGRFLVSRGWFVRRLVPRQCMHTIGETVTAL